MEKTKFELKVEKIKVNGNEVEAKRLIIDGEKTEYLVISDGKLYADGTGVFVEGELPIIKIKCFNREDKQGKKFIAYKALCENKRYLDLSFTLDCGIPDDKTDFVLIDAEYNVDTNRLYPRVYVLSYGATIPYIKELKDTLKFARSGE